jgi:hypothetical protein
LPCHIVFNCTDSFLHPLPLHKEQTSCLSNSHCRVDMLSNNSVVAIRGELTAPFASNPEAKLGTHVHGLYHYHCNKCERSHKFLCELIRCRTQHSFHRLDEFTLPLLHSIWLRVTFLGPLPRGYVSTLCLGGRSLTTLRMFTLCPFSSDSKEGVRNFLPLNVSLSSRVPRGPGHILN